MPRDRKDVQKALKTIRNKNKPKAQKKQKNNTKKASTSTTQTRKSNVPNPVGISKPKTTKVSFKPTTNASKQYSSFKTSSFYTNKNEKKYDSLADARQAYKQGKNTTYLGTKQKTTTTEVGKKKHGGAKEKLTSVNALTKGEFNRMTYASSLNNKKLGNKLLKGGSRTGQSDIRKKVGSKTAESAYKSKAATGFMQGMSKADIFSNSVGTYNKSAKEAIKQTKDSTAYNVGYGVGMAADMGIGGIGSRGASAAELSGKAAKKVAEKFGKKAVEKSTKSAVKTFTKNRAGELIAETPSNILDAAKMSMDENGKVDKKELAKWAAINSGLTVGVGGALEGIGAAVTKKQVNEVADLLAKQKNGKLTDDEAKTLKKVVGKLDKKANKDVETTSKVMAENSDATRKYKTNIENEKVTKAAGQKTTQEELAKQVEKANRDYYYEGIERVKADRDRKAKAKKESATAESYANKQREKDVTRITEQNKKLETELEDIQVAKKNARTQEEYQRLTDREQVVSSSIKNNQEKLAQGGVNETDRMTTQEFKDAYNEYLDAQSKPQTIEEHQRLVDKEPELKASFEKRFMTENQPVSATKVADDTVTPNGEKNLSKQAETPQTATTEAKATEDVADTGTGGYAEKIAELNNEKVEIAKEHTRLKDVKTEIRNTDPNWKTNPEYQAAELKQRRLREDDKALDKKISKYRKSYNEGKSLDEALDVKAEKVKAESKKAEKKGKEVVKKTEADGRSRKSESVKTIQRVRMALVDNFAALEDIAKSKPKEVRELTLARINELRKSQKTAKAVLATEGRPIYVKHGLTGRSEMDAVKRGDYELYAYLKHHLDRLTDDPETSTGFLEFTRKEALQEMRRLRKAYGKDIVEFQNEMVGYFDNLLQREVDAGITSAEKAAEFRQMYPNYVPTFIEKDFDDALDTATYDEINSRRGQKKAVGNSGVGLIPLYDQMAAKTNTVIKRAELNKTLDVLYDICDFTKAEADDVLKDIPEEKRPEALLNSQVFTTVKGGKYKAVFYKGGEKVEVSIDKNVYDGIRLWSGEDRKTLALIDNRATEFISRNFKKWITDYNLYFGAKNFVRDSATALFYTKDLKNYVKAFPKAVGCVFLPKSFDKFVPSMKPYREIFEQYKKHGGIYSQFITSGKLQTELLDKKEVSKLNPFKYVEDLNSMLETVPRLQEYISAIDSSVKNGNYDDVFKDDNLMAQAMYRSKDVTINFDRGGWLGKKLNRGLVPFFNPAIQGLSKLGRVLVTDNIQRDGGKIVANKTFKEFMKLGTLLTGMVAFPTLAWDGIFGDYINGKKDGYEKQSDYNRYSNYLLPVGDGKFVKIPKARELASIQAFMDFAFDNMTYGSGNTWERLFSENSVRDASSLLKISWSQIGTVNPVTDNIISPVVRTALGKKWYDPLFSEGGSLETATDEVKREQGKVADIWDEETTLPAKQIGAALNISPKKVDNILDSYLGLIYDMGLKQTSLKNSHKGETPMEAVGSILKSTIANNFLIDSLFQNSYKSDNYVRSTKLEKKLEKLTVGTPEYNEVKAEINRNKNAFSFTSMEYDELTAQIYLDENLTAREKKKYVSALKESQNNMWRASVDGKKTSPTDPMADAWNLKDKKGKRVLSADTIINSCSYTSKGKDKKLGTSDDYNVIKDAWETYKKNGGNAAKFMKMTIDAREVSRYCGESLTFPTWRTMAFATVLNGTKNPDKVLEAYSVQDSQMEDAKKYQSYGGTIKNYKVSHKAVAQAAYDIGLDYTSEMEQWDKANALSRASTKNGKRYRDLAYFAEDSYTLKIMNASRCLANGYPKSNWTTGKIHKFCKDNGFSYKDKPYPDADEVASAIEKKWGNKTMEEKAAVFEEICPGKTNPFGSVGDYSLGNDTGIKSGSGYGRRGHRGGGGSGGGSGSKKTKSSTVSYKGKVTDVSFKSNLDDAYRKKLKKLREQTRD